MGVRALLHVGRPDEDYDPGFIEPPILIRNRKGVDVTAVWPDVVARTRRLLDRPDIEGVPFVLDGEIVCVDGSFESTPRRDRQSTPRSIANQEGVRGVQIRGRRDLSPRREGPARYARLAAQIEPLAEEMEEIKRRPDNAR